MTFYVMLNDGTLSWIKFYFESMKRIHVLVPVDTT